MKKTIFSLIFLSVGLAFAEPVDSIGTKVKNGKIFILHEVEKGQGLFSISRRYGVELTRIIAANPGSDKVINVGQVLFIPTDKNAPFEEKVVKDYFSQDKPAAAPDESKKGEKTTFAGYHEVQEGETLYSISRKYQTTVEVIKDLNNLGDAPLSLGQKLMVPKKEDTQEIKSENKSDLAKSQQDLKQNESPKDQKTSKKGGAVSKENYSKTIEKITEFDIEKISEKGFAAELAKEEADPTRNYCHHHEAEVGTVIMVTNPANGKSVFVKVLKNVPLNEEEGVMIYLTEAARKSINLDKSKARVELNYAR